MQWKNDTYTGWGRALKAQGELARPERIKELRDLFRESAAPAIGARRSYGDAALNSGGRAIDMTRLDRLISFDPDTGVVEAEAGVTMADLVKIFVPKGWMPAAVPGTGAVTLGGAIAFDVHGKNHADAGSFGQYIESLHLIGLNKARTISPKREAKLFAATMGGMGQTGIIESARLRLVHCPSPGIELVETRVSGLAEMVRRIEDSSAPFTVGWIDTQARGDDLGRGILEEARFPGLAPEEPISGRVSSVPFDMPSFVLSGAFVKLFNALYLRRVSNAGRIRIVDLHDFLFPLDKIAHWNRLYGRRGMHQFQAILPETEMSVIEAILGEIANGSVAAPLAVLKKTGPGHAGPMSVPMEG